MPRPPISLRYTEHGAGGAGPVVLIHGFPLNRAMWDELVPALADKYHVIVPDMRGHGETEGTDGPYEMVDHAGDVLALLDTLGHKQAAIIGLSMGGYILEHVMVGAPERLSAIIGLSMGGYILEHVMVGAPERLSAVILADTMGRADPPERVKARRAQAEMIRKDGLEAFAEQVLPRMFAPSVPAERPDLVERFRQTILSQRPESVIHALLGIGGRPDMLAQLRGVRIPTLVLVGAEDLATTPEHAHELASTIPDATLVILPGAGHMSNWEDTEGFNRAVRTFLDQTVGKA